MKVNRSEKVTSKRVWKLRQSGWESGREGESGRSAVVGVRSHGASRDVGRRLLMWWTVTLLRKCAVFRWQLNLVLISFGFIFKCSRLIYMTWPTVSMCFKDECAFGVLACCSMANLRVHEGVQRCSFSLLKSETPIVLFVFYRMWQRQTLNLKLY